MVEEEAKDPDRLLREIMVYLQGGWGMPGLIERVKRLEDAEADRADADVVRDAILTSLRWSLTLGIPLIGAIVIAIITTR